MYWATGAIENISHACAVGFAANKDLAHRHLRETYISEEKYGKRSR